MPFFFYMDYQFFFPTIFCFDWAPDLVEKLLPLCNKYTAESTTNLLGHKNFPSTLYDELSNSVNEEPLVIETLETIHQRYVKPMMEFRNLKYDRNDFSKPFGFFSSMEMGAMLRKHSHRDCKFSGILYLECGEDVPSLVFHDPRPFTKFTEGNFQTDDVIAVKAETNKFVLWDHWLEHEVLEKENNQSRKAFSFNI